MRTEENVPQQTTRPLGKQFRVQNNIGKAKYVVSHHDGAKAHPDGSAFFDATILRSKVALARFTRGLKADGYAEASAI